MSQEKIERWNEVDGNLDNGEKLQAFLDSTTDAYAILQLRRTDETVYERFESYEALKRQGKEPNIDHYGALQQMKEQLEEDETELLDLTNSVLQKLSDMDDEVFEKLSLSLDL